jgi:hypothetical protein
VSSCSPCWSCRQWCMSVPYCDAAYDQVSGGYCTCESVEVEIVVLFQGKE